MSDHILDMDKHGKPRPVPEELGDILFYEAINVPIAVSIRDLEDVPARLVDDLYLLRAAQQDAREWQQLNQKGKGGRRKVQPTGYGKQAQQQAQQANEGG